MKYYIEIGDGYLPKTPYTDKEIDNNYITKDISRRFESKSLKIIFNRISSLQSLYDDIMLPKQC